MKVAVNILALSLIFTFLFPIESQGANKKPEDLTEDLRLLIQEDKSQTLNKNEVENVLEKWENQVLTKEELSEQIIEMKDDKISLLEGNIGWILAIASILLVLFGAVFTLISIFWRNSLKKEFDIKIQEIKNVGTNVETDKKEVEKNKALLDDCLQELKQAKRELEENQILLRDSRFKFEGKSNEIESFRTYLRFIDFKTSEVEAVNKYNLCRTDSINIRDTIEYYIQKNQMINENQVLLRIYKKIPPYVTKAKETVNDIFNYFEKCLEEEEKNISIKLQNNMDYESYLKLTDGGNETDMHSDLISSIDNWNSYLKSLKEIKSCIEVEITLNSKNN